MPHPKDPNPPTPAQKRARTIARKLLMAMPQQEFERFVSDLRLNRICRDMFGRAIVEQANHSAHLFKLICRPRDPGRRIRIGVR